MRKQMSLRERVTRQYLAFFWLVAFALGPSSQTAFAGETVWCTCGAWDSRKRTWDSPSTWYEVPMREFFSRPFRAEFLRMHLA